MKKIFVIGLLLFLSGCWGQTKDIGSVDMDVNEVVDENHLLNEELSNNEVQSLIMAIDDEYKAKATYEAVIEKFGEIKPFANIVKAEQSHIEELLVLFEGYAVTVPNDAWEINPDDFEDKEQACQTGVVAEINNTVLYDELLKNIEHNDIKEVFLKLQSASNDSHLPAFENCAD